MEQGHCRAGLNLAKSQSKNLALIYNVSCSAWGGGELQIQSLRKNQLYDPFYVKNRCTDNPATPRRN